MFSRLTTTVFVTSVFSAALPAQSAADAVGRVSNWAAPLYWQAPDSRPVPHRAGAGKKPSATMGAAAAAVSSNTSAPAVFVAMTPCRVVDTRVGILPFGTPNFAAGEIRTIPMPTSPDCPVPSNALAYSLNIAVVPLTGSMRWLTAWNTGAAQPATATLNDKAGVVTSNSAVVPAGDSGSINVYVTDPTHLIIDINGYYVSNQETPNRQAIALLKWFPAYASATFPVGTGPRGVAFDGAHIWVVNFDSSSVTKLRASDGANLGSFNVGSNPYALCFDGANMWVGNTGDNTLTKLRASDGVNLGTFSVGKAPVGMAFDGANVWVGDSIDTVTRLRATDGVNLGTFKVESYPGAIVFDGATVWVANNGGNSVTKLRSGDGANLGTFPVGQNPSGLAFDGANVWVANRGNGTVTKLRASDGANLGSFWVGNYPVGMAFDGINLWVANWGSNTATKLRASDGANLGTFPVGQNPSGMAFDGTNIWVANSYDSTVTKL